MRFTDPKAPPPSREPEPAWNQSLATGAPGLVLLHVEYAKAGVADWATVYRWAASMTRGPILAHPGASLFHGAPAVAYALRAVNRPDYESALATLDEHVAALTRRRLNDASQRITSRQSPNLREFDLISGLTGIGVYLLRANNTSLLREVLSYLVRLTESVTTRGERLPGWWTTNGPADRPSRAWPGGHVNLGLAHGIAGPLALLAAAMIRAITVPGHAEAINRITAVLDTWRQPSPSSPWWPGLLSRAEWTTSTLDQPGPQRPSWCYGTPGLARAQQLAARALRNPRRQRRAEAALAACVTDESQLLQLGDASLCHGWAGLLHTTWRAATTAGPDSELPSALTRLRARWDQHRHTLPHHDGLLDGAAGVALVHQTISHDRHDARWDDFLLSSPLTRTEGDR